MLNRLMMIIGRYIYKMFVLLIAGIIGFVFGLKAFFIALGICLVIVAVVFFMESPYCK